MTRAVTSAASSIDDEPCGQETTGAVGNEAAEEEPPEEVVAEETGARGGRPEGMVAEGEADGSRGLGANGGGR